MLTASYVKKNTACGKELFLAFGCGSEHFFGGNNWTIIEVSQSNYHNH